MAEGTQSRRAFAGAILALVPLRAAAQITLPKDVGGLLNQLQTGKSRNAAGAGLSQNEIGLGLKDALKVASRHVIGRVGKPDGYNADPAIRIPLPGRCRKSSSRFRPSAPNSSSTTWR